MALQKFWRVKIYVPVESAVGEEVLEQITKDTPTNVQDIVDVIGRIPGVGQVGNYSDLYELDFGFESYRANEGASPRFGKIGETVNLRKAAMVTYLRYDCEPHFLELLVAEIKKVHPWEHPVIEFTECLLYVPSRGT